MFFPDAKWVQANDRSMLFRFPHVKLEYKKSPVFVDVVCFFVLLLGYTPEDEQRAQK